MIPENEPTIARDDSTPTLANQCAANKWGFDFFNFGLGEDRPATTYFNPTIVQRPDGIWLLVRVSEISPAMIGMNNIFAFMLDETGKVPKVGYKLAWPNSDSDEQHEDARACYFSGINQTAVCATNFKWYGHGQHPSWTGATQEIGFFDEEWNCKVKHRPPIGGNPNELRNITVKEYEKSWCPFSHEGQLHIMYAPDPWRIYRFGQTWKEAIGYEYKQGISWKYGKLRNGSPPILVNGEYVVFVHSSLPWRGNYRRYYMGAVAFEAKPPFSPLRITPEPLLIGSQQDPWKERKPPCIFPGGALYNNGLWQVVFGVNDLKCAWAEIPHQSLLDRLQPIDQVGQTILPITGLSEGEIKAQTLRQSESKPWKELTPEEQKLRRQQQMQKARAARGGGSNGQEKDDEKGRKRKKRKVRRNAVLAK